MVSYTQVKASNSSASSNLPAGLVAVFAGATAGIGEAALKAFAKHTVRPRIYFIGRSQDAGDRLQKELKDINPNGEYIFIKADMSLLKNADEVCKDIKMKEKFINVLFMSQGSLKLTGKSLHFAPPYSPIANIMPREDTEEGLPYITALSLYSRTRLITNLLPLLQNAPTLRRVITVLAATKEGPLHITDIAGRNIPFTAARGHLSTVVTLTLEHLARQAPTVSFVHNFPGSVDTNLIRREDGVLMLAMKYLFKASTAVRRGWVPLEECGERHAFLCLSGRYAPREKGEAGEEVAVGADGKVGSGFYSVDWDGESAGGKVVELLDRYRGEGAVEKVWGRVEGEFKRITGSLSI